MSVTNALRQLGYNVSPLRAPVSDSNVRGYIYGNDDVVFGVEKDAITYRELVNKTRGYKIYHVRNPYT